MLLIGSCWRCETLDCRKTAREQHPNSDQSENININTRCAAASLRQLAQSMGIDITELKYQSIWFATTESVENRPLGTGVEEEKTVVMRS
jgi:hypothetical protein